MTTQPIMTEESKAAHSDHIAWLNDCGKWRSEHRKALAMLAKVESAILEQEAAMEDHAAEIQLHEMHLQKYNLTEDIRGDVDYELLEQEHTKFQEHHDRTRNAHERLTKHHVRIVPEVEKLLKLCESAM